MPAKRFYDIHMHVFNLSHAGLMAFINRFFLNNALRFDDLLEGRYFKIIRHYMFKKGHSRAESQALMRKRVIFLSMFIIIFLAWVFLWFFVIPGRLYFIPAGSLQAFISWLLLACGFLLIPLLLGFLLYTGRSVLKRWVLKKEKSKSIPRSINVLSVFENDLAHQLRYLELDYLSLHDDIRDYIFGVDEPDPKIFYGKLRTLWERHNHQFPLGRQQYGKVVLTPLMMNFDSKGFEKLDKQKIHYNLPPAKLIIEQLVDLFNGIQEYCRGSLGLLQIFPFMGINTGSYRHGRALKTGSRIDIPERLLGKVVFLRAVSVLVFVRELSADERDVLLSAAKDDALRDSIREAMDDFHKAEFKDTYPRENTLPKMLDKYFGEYRGEIADFEQAFNEMFYNPASSAMTWRDLGSNFFSGIKVYPPLGFDPNPPEAPLEAELGKALKPELRIRLQQEYFNTWVNTHYLYQYCEDKNIPVTTHCSDGGFVIMDERWSRERANPACWSGVLEQYPQLKLNFGHFGVQLRSARHGWGEWNRTIIGLILNDRYPNVYADISDLGASPETYHYLGRAVEESIDSMASGGADKDELRRKLMRKLLFGTDFMVNLFGADSYLAYLKTWEETTVFTPEEKEIFVSENPGRFLFGEAF
jgi:hypothetical protein